MFHNQESYVLSYSVFLLIALATNEAFFASDNDFLLSPPALPTTEKDLTLGTFTLYVLLHEEMEPA